MKKKLTGYYWHITKKGKFFSMSGDEGEWRECEIIGINDSSFMTLIKNKDGELLTVYQVYYN